MRHAEQHLIKKIHGYQAIRFQVDGDKPIAQQRIPSVLKEKNEGYMDPDGCGVITIFKTQDGKRYVIGALRPNPCSSMREYQISIGGGVRDKNASFIEALNTSIRFKTSEKHPSVNKENLSNEGVALLYLGEDWKMHFLTVYQYWAIESLEELKALVHTINVVNAKNESVKNIQYDIFDLEVVIASVANSVFYPDGAEKHKSAGNILSSSDMTLSEEQPTKIIYDDIALDFLSKTTDFCPAMAVEESENSEKIFSFSRR